MMYPFITLPDETEIVHSDMYNDGSVKVYIERPDEKKGFLHASCYIPGYKWEDIDGFSAKEIDELQKIIKSTAHLMLEYAQYGGFDNAANF